MQILWMWIAYLIAAVGCYWAWTKMFFWVKQPETRLFVKLIGAVLLFMPAPATEGQQDYMPAFIIVIFRGILDRDPNYIDAVIWMLSGLVVGMLVVGAYLFSKQVGKQVKTSVRARSKS